MTFGLVKRHLRREASYALNANFQNVNNEIDLEGDENSGEQTGVNADSEESTSIDLNDHDVPLQNRAERGLALAEYVLDILDAFERSTSKRLVVSAFRQAGILSRFPDLNDMTRRVTYIDRSFARAVIRKTGLFEGSAPLYDERRKLLKIGNLRPGEGSRAELENENVQSGGGGAQNDATQSPTSHHPVPAPLPSPFTAPGAHSLTFPARHARPRPIAPHVRSVQGLFNSSTLSSLSFASHSELF